MSAFDFETAIEKLTESNTYEEVELDWVGLGHVVLPTCCFFAICYILIIKNYAKQQSSYLTNIYCITLISQLFVCLGFQIEMLYYKQTTLGVSIFGIIFCKNFGFCNIFWTVVYLGLAFHFVGIKNASAKSDQEIIKNNRYFINTVTKKYFLGPYVIGLVIWMVAVFVNGYYGYLLLFLLCIPACLIFSTVMYWKFAKTVNWDTREEWKSVSDARTNKVYYNIGLIGWLYMSVNFTVILVIVLVLRGAISLVSAVLVGFAYVLILVGMEFVTSLKPFRMLAWDMGSVNMANAVHVAAASDDNNAA